MLNSPSIRILSAMIAAFIFVSCATSEKTETNPAQDYVPDDRALHVAIVALDKQFFDAYNSCNIAVLDSMISEDLEFYHDQGGLVDSKAVLMTGLRNNICGEGKKVRRELLVNTTEVYRIKEYGAVQMSIHRFHNEVEGSVGRPARVIQLWREERGVWKMTRAISLH